MTTPVNIGFLVYPDLVQLDLMGAYQVLAFPPNTQIYLLWKTLTPVLSNEGLLITPTTILEDCPKLDILCVPGGGIRQIEVMKDIEVIRFLQQKSISTRYMTSVCTGSLILAAANLLQGYKATCHWAFRDQLALLGVDVIPERVVVDRDRVTGAGVTSGIDFGLTLVTLLWGEKMAQMIQLMMEYNPHPPFHTGTPETASQDLVESCLQLGEPLIEAFSHQIQETIRQSKKLKD